MEEVAQTLRSSLAAQSETLNEVRSQSSYLSSRLQDSLTTNSMAQKDFKTKAEQLNEKVYLYNKMYLGIEGEGKATI